ncbi:MAG: zf-HC2 domain-containing protein [Candidatus Hydrogenedentes bacterium]|nr:zf-HC2 domain-containing protein [Candidatus Hydrogenedentota bacterium]
MTCKQIKDYLDGLLLAEPTPLETQAVEDHIRHCVPCRAEYEAAQKTLALLQPSTKPTSTDSLKERIMNNITSAESHPAQQRPRIRFLKPAMAAAAAFAVLALLVYPFVQPSSSYAFAQTIDATRSVQSIHLRMTPVTFGSVGEIWAQFNQNAQLVRLRMNFPDTEDGPKDVVWENEKAQIWFKKKNCISTVREPDILRKLKANYDFFDPAQIVENLYKKAQGSAEVDIKEPAKPGEPIIITVTAPTEPGCKDVYTVDSKTKLLLHRDAYRPADGQQQVEFSTEYLDYNQVEPSVFTLEAPPDTMRIDMTEGVGIEQGALSDEEIATKVAREFFEALIVKDYAKASPLYSGMPAAKLQEAFGGTNFVRVISMGPPEPHEKTGSLRVPCKIERKIDGKTETFEPNGPFVRQVEGRPGYWTIIGGI